MSRLVIFLAFYFFIYGASHLYLLMKTRRAFYLDGVQYVLLFAIFTFLLLAPINASLLESQGHWLLALILAWIGFVWMGFVFIFVCLSLPVDGYHLLVGTGQQLLGTDWTAFMLSKRQIIGLVTLATLAIMTYGAFEAYRIKTEHITLHTTKLSVAAGTVRIVQISDLHIGPMFYPGRIGPMIEAITKAQPDILVSTGDLIDGRPLNASTLITKLKGISAPLGKFAVTGNHEFYAGIKPASAFTEQAGFTLLRHQSTAVTGELTIIGVDDPVGDKSAGTTDKKDLAKTVSKNSFSLLLKHRPVIGEDLGNNIDLQLSGHAHKGQIFPFDALVRLSYPWGYGLRQYAPGRHLYTSRGTGTWGPPIRVLAPPEITIIDLVPRPRNPGGMKKKGAQRNPKP